MLPVAAHELIAREAAWIVRIGPGRQRIVNDDRLPGGVAQIGEIAAPPFGQRHGERSRARRPLPIAFVIDEEERFVIDERAADIAAELISFEAAFLLPGAIG